MLPFCVQQPVSMSEKSLEYVMKVLDHFISQSFSALLVWTEPTQLCHMELKFEAKKKKKEKSTSFVY